MVCHNGHGIDQAEVMHADQMEKNVSAQILIDNGGAVLLYKQHAGLIHLGVSYESARESYEIISNVIKLMVWWAIKKKNWLVPTGHST